MRRATAFLDAAARLLHLPPTFLSPSATTMHHHSPLAPASAFTHSPLNDLSHTAQHDAIAVAFCDPEVQRAAGACVAKLEKLRSLCGLRSEIAAAIAVVLDDAEANLEAQRVVKLLRLRASALDDALEAAREDKAAHDAAHKARLLRLQPLRAAVSNRLSALSQERESCLTRIEALRRSALIDFDRGALRHTNLLAAGLSVAEINSLGPAAQPVAAQEQVLRERIAALDDQLVPLWAFSNDPFHGPHHLAGLGFDDLIANVSSNHVPPATEVV